MNCKQGEMAMYVGSDPRCRGFIVRCLERKDWFDTPAWVVDPALPSSDEFECGEWVVDGSLRPIRDPGDDAQDETLSWLPVPLKEHA